VRVCACARVFVLHEVSNRQRHARLSDTAKKGAGVGVKTVEKRAVEWGLGG